MEIYAPCCMVFVADIFLQQNEAFFHLLSGRKLHFCFRGCATAPPFLAIDTQGRFIDHIVNHTGTRVDDHGVLAIHGSVVSQGIYSYE